MAMSGGGGVRTPPNRLNRSSIPVRRPGPEVICPAPAGDFDQLRLDDPEQPTTTKPRIPDLTRRPDPGPETGHPRGRLGVRAHVGPTFIANVCDQRNSDPLSRLYSAWACFDLLRSAPDSCFNERAHQRPSERPGPCPTCRHMLGGNFVASALTVVAIGTAPAAAYEFRHEVTDDFDCDGVRDHYWSDYQGTVGGAEIAGQFTIRYSCGFTKTYSQATVPTGTRARSTTSAAAAPGRRSTRTPLECMAHPGTLTASAPCSPPATATSWSALRSPTSSRPPGTPPDTGTRRAISRVCIGRWSVARRTAGRCPRARSAGSAGGPGQHHHQAR